MLTVDFEMGGLGDLDYRPIGDVMHKTGMAISQALQKALSGDAVFPGMTGPAHAKDATVSYETHGELELSVTAHGLGTVETGKPAYDMKPAIYSGPRHRVAKDGHWYVIVPFMHDAEQLPKSIADMAAQLETSAIIGHYIDALGVTRNTYRWGEGGVWHLPNMPATSLVGLSVSQTGYVGSHSRYSHMVKMQGSGYMTFRTASANSPFESWWHPETPPNPVTESVWAFMAPLAQMAIRQAWEEVFTTWLS